MEWEAKRGKAVYCTTSSPWSALDTERFECYVDIPGKKTANEGTLPADIAITSSRPDIVIIDRNAKFVHIFELTVPFEMNIDSAHLYKENRYGYLLADITSVRPFVTNFEIGVRGYVSKSNHERLKSLHKYCKKGLKLKKFIENISALAINSSYFMFLCRKDTTWSDPPPLRAPFKDGICDRLSTPSDLSCT